MRIEEFQGKIEAAISARSDPDFLVIARTEALIAGLGEVEALHRAHAYMEAGADMILIHSKSKAPCEIESFARAWTGTLPLVIVPNAYPDLDAKRVKMLGNIRMMIYGNTAFVLLQLPCRRPSAGSSLMVASRMSTRISCRWMRSSESRIWKRPRRLKLASFAKR